MADVYEITIELRPSGGEPSQPSDGENAPPENSGGGQSATDVAAASSKNRANPAKAIVAKLVKQTSATALSNYGNITGDYIVQQNIQTVVGEAASIAGAVAMGPVGMALYAIDKGFQVYDYVARLKRSEAEAAFRQERVYASTHKA